jgi:hypothetical protein
LATRLDFPGKIYDAGWSRQKRQTPVEPRTFALMGKSKKCGHLEPDPDNPRVISGNCEFGEVRM